MTEPTRVRALFERALRLPAAERVAFVLREANNDADLAYAVIFLLESAPQSGAPKTVQVDASLASRLKAAFGKDLDPKVSLAGDDSRMGDSSLLDNLLNRTATTSRYDFGDEIARGGMGAISRVYDRDLRRHIAMKVMLDDDPSRLARFLEEAQVTGQLDHPNIVPVHELGIDASSRVFFTMKLVKGETLNDVFAKVVNQVDGWNLTRALSVILRVCEAMAFAHAKGVLHRDIKPANVMVGRFGEVYVMDWGLARVIGRADTRDLRLKPDEGQSVVRTERRDMASDTPDSPLITMEGMVMGTPSYMPPEQAEGTIDSIGPHSDVYAVGAILYRLLSGCEPYREPGSRMSSHQILNRVIAGPPRPVHEIAKDISAELLAIQEKAMARRIEDRYPSMTALGDDLRAYLENRVVSAHATGAIAELRKWVQRNPALAAAASVLVLVLAAATAIVTQQKREVDSKNIALGRANDEITARKSEVEGQKRIVDAKIREFDQLAGKVHLERAIAREKDLYPPWPEKVDPMQRWLAEDAKRLLDLKPTLERTLADLRSRAMPPSDAERENARRTHPRSHELDILRHRLEWLRTRKTTSSRGASQDDPLLPSPIESKRAIEWNAYAWKRVDPDASKRLFGEERLALAAIRGAVAKIETGDTSMSLAAALDTLAWAYVANGLDEEARTASARALELAPPNKKADYRSATEALEAAIAALLGEAGANLESTLESQIAALESEIDSNRACSFALESETFLYSALSDLATSIATFETGTRADVEKRLAWAMHIDDLTKHHPNARHTWEEARAAIAKADDVVASKLYASSLGAGGPIDLQPQPGLVPIGMNPITKLWEFYELRSACDLAAGQDPATIEIPTHRADGSIEVKDGTGIVFVLLPGGRFLQGAQVGDRNASNFDPNADSDEWPQEVTLAPFFLARHEMTRAQWYRLSNGEEPSTNARNIAFPNDPPIGWCHPVESVEWTMCRDLFARHGMTLPTEARWEYAARGGTTSVWWTGEEPASLAGAANVLDLRATKANPNWGIQSGDFDDGFIGSCRVGSLRANGFGLHDVVGNVWEWCLDTYDDHYGPARSGDGLRIVDASLPPYKIYRGGSYYITASVARSADRNRMAPSARNANVGVRPARDLLLAGDSRSSNEH